MEDQEVQLGFPAKIFFPISQTLSANYAFFAKKNFAKCSDNNAEFREYSKMCEIMKKTKVQGN